MEQIIFLVLVAVVGLLRWISQAAEERRNREAEKRTGAPAPNAPMPRAPAETEEERIRRFMEALGVPTANAPIPKAEPKREAPQPAAPAAAPKRKAPPIDPFPRGGFPIPPVVIAKPAPPPPLPQQPAPAPAPPPLFPAPPSAAPPAPPPLPTRETTLFAPAAPPEFEVRDVSESIDEMAQPVARGDKAGAQRRVAAPELTLAARLRTAGGLRDAIVLREIFGPPRSMQPLDLTRD